MSSSKVAILVGTLASISRVSSHGVVTTVIADGVTYEGYNPYYQFDYPGAPATVGWTTSGDKGFTFIPPSAFTDPDIICHLDGKPASAYATVKAGSNVTLKWTPWIDNHHGPVLDYLANCNGPCETADKTKLEFFKIDEGGLIHDAVAPGNWSADALRENNSTWDVTIPADIAPGNYTLRHEIIALHLAFVSNGSQHYPQCINLKITGSGTETPKGTLATTFYKETDPGILIDIYQTISKYIIPGPPLYTASKSSKLKRELVDPVETGGALLSVTDPAPNATSAGVMLTNLLAWLSALVAAVVNGEHGPLGDRSHARDLTV